jgi:hypothetical protein
MRTEVHWIDLPGPGRLAVMPRPRGGEWLEGEIVALKDDGVDILISLLTSEEEAYLDLAEEGATARRHGLRFVSHPIWDRGIPEIPGPTWALARGAWSPTPPGSRSAPPAGASSRTPGSSANGSCAPRPRPPRLD